MVAHLASSQREGLRATVSSTTRMSLLARRCCRRRRRQHSAVSSAALPAVTMTRRRRCRVRRTQTEGCDLRPRESEYIAGVPSVSRVHRQKQARVRRAGNTWRTSGVRERDSGTAARCRISIPPTVIGERWRLHCDDAGALDFEMSYGSV